ncbi:MAG: NYN domain-containing protein [bacterium]|nr:NYN domain-containing protein [bacterium]
MVAQDKKIAVLIDGDNADATLIEQILNEASKFGRVTIKRIYADFTTTQMNGWKNQLNIFAIRPIQKFAYTKGKNSTDSALIIDAMDIMHSKLVDGFCIVSSDSDYTGIAHRVREEGLFVMGIGKAHTPEAFVKACENFTYTEILAPKQRRIEKSVEKTQVVGTPAHKVTSKPMRQIPQEVKKGLTNVITKEPIDMGIVNSAFEMVFDDISGLAMASQLGAALKKVDPTFDIRSYGHTSFSKFIEALKPQFEIVVRKDKQGQTVMVKRNK